MAADVADERRQNNPNAPRLIRARAFWPSMCSVFPLIEWFSPGGLECFSDWKAFEIVSLCAEPHHQYHIARRWIICIENGRNETLRFFETVHLAVIVVSVAACALFLARCQYELHWNWYDYTVYSIHIHYTTSTHNYCGKNWYGIAERAFVCAFAIRKCLCSKHIFGLMLFQVRIRALYGDRLREMRRTNGCATRLSTRKTVNATTKHSVSRIYDLFWYVFTIMGRLHSINVTIKFHRLFMRLLQFAGVFPCWRALLHRNINYSP